MSSRLHRISEPELEAKARQARYRVVDLAKQRAVSLRQLERYFLASRSITPEAWMNELRLRDAQTTLSTGELVKEAADHVGFSKASNFSRWYKRHCRSSPSEFDP